MIKLTRKIATSKYLALAFRLYMGAVFVYASVYKINYAGEFAAVIADYRIVPYWGVNAAAVILPWLELVCGSMLILGIRVRAASAVLAGLMFLFLAAIVSVLARGLDLGCGCFHSLEDPMDATTVVRDLVWLGMLVHVYFFDSVFHPERMFVAPISKRMEQ